MIAANAPRAVLFDLDGTLVDTAPDLCNAVNHVLAGLGRAAVPLARLREVVSKGGRAMLAVALPDLDDAARDALLPPFLARYAEALAVESEPFTGVPALLDALDARGVRWGIVTNKPEALAAGVVADVQAARAAGMPSAAALWGYRLPGEDPLQWGADHAAAVPADLHAIAGLAPA